jgi:hypothetical protein
MEREIDLKEVSDGRLYASGDMVRIGCNDCRGCSECCRVVEDTILLDPYDIFQLERCLQTGFEELLSERIELSVVDYLIQPHLKIRPGKGCTFLSEDGRCRIHDARPGFCRMYPMGRIYENGDFKYFLQVKECRYPDKTKVKLKKWLGIPNLTAYEQYIRDWHYFLKGIQKTLRETENQEIVKSMNLYLLNQFYVTAYETGGEEDNTAFYQQFYGRLKDSREALGNDI